MALSRERRTALAELQVAATRLQTLKLALKDEKEDDEVLVRMMANVGSCIDRAVAALNS